MYLQTTLVQRGETALFLLNDPSDQRLTTAARRACTARLSDRFDTGRTRTYAGADLSVGDSVAMTHAHRRVPQVTDEGAGSKAHNLELSILKININLKVAFDRGARRPTGRTNEPL